MSLNIKNPEADRLAHELAAVTGESLTEAVIQALRERLRRYTKEERLKRIHEIAEDIASRMTEPWKSMNWDDYLYDPETGLPR